MLENEEGRLFFAASHSRSVLPPLVRLFAPRVMGVIHGLDRFSVLHGHWMARINKERE